MNPGRKIVLILLVVFITIQFIQPAKNTKAGRMQYDLLNHLHVQGEVATLLKNSCYDCHSNNSRYPWYAAVQPMGWFLAKHIKEGKAALNFNEFGTFSKRRQQSKIKAIHNSIRDGSMPLASYTLLHPVAKLTEENKELMMEWAEKTANEISTKKIKRPTR